MTMISLKCQSDAAIVRDMMQSGSDWFIPDTDIYFIRMSLSGTNLANLAQIWDTSNRNSHSNKIHFILTCFPANSPGNASPSHAAENDSISDLIKNASLKRMDTVPIIQNRMSIDFILIIDKKMLSS